MFNWIAFLNPPVLGDRRRRREGAARQSGSESRLQPPKGGTPTPAFPETATLPLAYIPCLARTAASRFSSASLTSNRARSTSIFNSSTSLRSALFCTAPSRRSCFSFTASLASSILVSLNYTSQLRGADWDSDPRNVELLNETALTYVMVRQFPAALKVYDRALDIVPNDPDLMASKAGIYQAEGNLEQAAKFLPEINGQTPYGNAFVTKFTQLRLERNLSEGHSFAASPTGSIPLWF